MNGMSMHWVNRLAALGLAVGLTVALVTTGRAQSVAGQAYGVFVNTPAASQGQSPLAVLPPVAGTDGDIATAQADALDVPGTLSSSFLNSNASGAIGTQGVPTAAGAQSVASLGNVNILGGLITATGVIASVASTRTPGGAVSDANGSSFADLVVAGVPVTSGDGTVAPNTRMNLPGVGYVVLNEQTPTGDGVTSSGLTVNMIHVIVQDALTGLKTGEIIVGSATSSVGS